jgi:hypothetical protein
MSTTQIRQGGAPVVPPSLVNVDGETITGDGANVPLRAASVPTQTITISGGTGSGSVVKPGAAVTSSPNVGQVLLAIAGSATPPLGLAAKAGNTGTGATIVTSGPLTLTTAEWDAVVLGESGGLTPGAVYYVGGGSFNELTTAPVGPRVGQAASPTTMIVQIGGVPQVLNLGSNGGTVGMAVIVDEPTSTVVATPAQANALGASQVVGIALQLDAGRTLVQTAGLVTLTTAQWDAVVTSESGGLSPLSIYYLSAATPGFLTRTPPATTGTFVERVGVAVSATQLQLLIGVPVGPHA